MTKVIRKFINESKKLDSYLNLCTQFYDLIRPQPPEDAYAFYRT